jgi:serine phosphatase RsbU (regulator of sigma subunit)
MTDHAAPQRPSFASAPSFQARLVGAELWRVRLVIACFAVLLISWILRRMLHGTVAVKESVFIPIAVMLCGAIALLIGHYYDVRRRSSLGLPIPRWRLGAAVLIDLGVPLGILTILHFRSPRGAVAALSGPSLLIIPIVIMLSVLRLRPWYSLCLGLGAAAGHWSLAASSFTDSGVDAGSIPLLMAYGALLALAGGAAAVLSTLVRGYIREAASEAETAARTERELSEIEHDLGIAREIQQGLLPSRPPDLPGFDIAGMARPAEHAGGDYYDWQMLPDGRLVTAIADVTGHGIGPALVMAVCRAYARATVPTADSAAAFLERMNRLIVSDLTDGRFITMAVAIVGSDGKVELLSAGHGPTFCFRAGNGHVDRFGGDGLPLGIVEGERYNPTQYLHLDPGDVLVLITDGFVERADGSRRLFGADRLAETIARNAHRSAADIIAEVDLQTTAFAGGAPQGDDMTMVVLRRV